MPTGISARLIRSGKSKTGVACTPIIAARVNGIRSLKVMMVGRRTGRLREWTWKNSVLARVVCVDKKCDDQLGMGPTGCLASSEKEDIPWLP